MRRFSRWTGYLLLSFSILFLILALNWQPLSYSALKKIAQFYAGGADIRLGIGNASGRILSETTFRDVSILPAGGPQTYQFKARSIKCTYDLWDLRGGLEPFILGLDCSAEEPAYMHDFSIESLQGQTLETPPWFFVPGLLPGLELRNGSVILVDTGWTVEINGVNSVLRPGVAAHELQLEAENFRFIQQDNARIETGFAAQLRYGKAKLSIDSLELGEQEIRASGSIDLARSDQGGTDFAVELVFGESRLSAAGSVADQLLKLQFSTDRFDIGELQKRLGGAGWDIYGLIKGEAGLAYNLRQPGGVEGTFSLAVREGRLNGVYINSVTGKGGLRDGILAVSSAEAGTPANNIYLRNVSVPLGRAGSGTVLSLISETQGEFTAEINDIEELLILFALGEENVPEALRSDSLSFRGKLAAGVLYLEDARVVAPDFNLTAVQGEIDVPATVEALGSAPVALSVKVESSDLTEFAGRFGEIAVAGQVAADMKIKGTVLEPRGEIILAGAELVFRERRLGSLSLQGDLLLLQKKIGSLQEARFNITELAQVNGSGALGLHTPISGSWQPAGFSVEGTLQIDGQSEVSGRVVKAPGSDTSVEVSAGNLDSDGWLGNFIDKRYFFHGADLEVLFSGSPQAPQLKIAGKIDKTGGADVPFPLTGKFGLQYSSAGIEISEFTWESHARNRLTLTGRLPYDPLAAEPYLDGELSLNGHADFPALEDIAVFLEPLGIGRGSLALDLDLRGSWDQPVGHVLLKGEGVEPPAALKQHLDSPMNLICEVAAQVDSIVLKSASLESTAYTARATGSWRHDISFRELLQKRRAELKGEVAADASVQLKDLSFLRKKLPWLRRLEGDMQGEIHVEGPVTGPAMKGSFSLQNGEASHVFNFPMLSAVNLHGDFDERTITIKNMEAELGGSPTKLSGDIYTEKDGVAVNLHVVGENVLLFRNNDMRLRGDVRLDISGPIEHLAIKGTAGLTGGYYTRNIDFLGKIGSSAAPVSEGVSYLFSFPEPPLKNAVFDIKITTLEPFRIRNNLIRGGLRPELFLKGTGELPFLAGTIYIDQSRVLLPSGRLQIQSGLLRFLEDKPDRPQLDILARSKILGYDINVVARGTVADPVITLSSSPALPNDDLLLLLLTGQPPKQDVAGGTKGSGTRNVMVYLGRDFLTRWLEDESEASDETILDRFELDFGRSVTKSGDQTVESTFRLSKETTRTGKIYYLSGEKDKYDAYNYGLKLVFRLE